MAGSQAPDRPHKPKRPALASVPRGLEGRLREGAVALGLQLGDTTREKLVEYLSLLLKWNAVYNLTAVRDPDAMLVHHLLDSLAIVRPLEARARAGSSAEGAMFRQVVDVGSGGGLPGIVLSLAWPDARIHLVEPVGKKAAFLRQCAAELALAHTEVHDCRVEELSLGATAGPDLIVCRAFASLPDFVAGVDALVAPTTIVAAMKGAVPEDEIAALPADWRLAETLPLVVPGLEARRHLLLLERSGGKHPST